MEESGWESHPWNFSCCTITHTIDDIAVDTACNLQHFCHLQRRSFLVASLGIFLEKLESRSKNAGDELTSSLLFDLHCHNRDNRQ